MHSSTRRKDEPSDNGTGVVRIAFSAISSMACYNNQHKHDTPHSRIRAYHITQTYNTLRQSLASFCRFVVAVTARDSLTTTLKASNAGDLVPEQKYYAVVSTFQPVRETALRHIKKTKFGSHGDQPQQAGSSEQLPEFKFAIKYEWTCFRTAAGIVRCFKPGVHLLHSHNNNFETQKWRAPL